MTTATDVLDAAYERLSQWGFDEPRGYVNHAPMVCEALAALGRLDEVDAWSRLDEGSPPVVAVEPRSFVWQEALGDLSRTAEWMGYFEQAVVDQGWQEVLSEWLPRLLPGLAVALCHGAIRTAHATRAIAAADTPARRAELVRSLGYWAALCEPGYPPDLDAVRDVADPRLAVVAAAAAATRHYLAKPNIINLHGITAAMAVAILVEHADDATALAALAQVKAEHAALYERTSPVIDAPTPQVDEATLVDAAIASGDAHAVKLVEACTRGFAATGDPAFLAAAERGARRGLRLLAQDPATSSSSVGARRNRRT